MVLRVGAAINQLLGANQALVALVGNKIFPLAVQADEKRPFLIYQRTGLAPAYTKDTRQKDSVFMGITIISERYSESVEIASEVIEALEHKRGKHAGVDIDDIKLLDANEEADEINFIQALEFEVFINL